LERGCCTPTPCLPIKKGSNFATWENFFKLLFSNSIFLLERQAAFGEADKEGRKRGDTAEAKKKKRAIGGNERKPMGKRRFSLPLCAVQWEICPDCCYFIVPEGMERDGEMNRFK